MDFGGINQKKKRQMKGKSKIMLEKIIMSNLNVKNKTNQNNPKILYNTTM